MPIATITKGWGRGIQSAESHIDKFKEDPETLFNTTGLDYENFQNNGIATASLSSSMVTTAKLDSSSVTSSSIDVLAVTQAKRASLTVDSEIFYFTTGATVNTTGRPVFIGIASQDNGLGSYIGMDNSISFSTATLDAIFTLTRTQNSVSTVIAKEIFKRVRGGGTTTSDWKFLCPIGMYFIDVPQSGSVTYTMALTTSNTLDNTSVFYTEMKAFEL